MWGVPVGAVAADVTGVGSVAVGLVGSVPVVAVPVVVRGRPNPSSAIPARLARVASETGFVGSIPAGAGATIEWMAGPVEAIWVWSISLRFAASTGLAWAEPPTAVTPIAAAATATRVRGARRKKTRARA